ncbi:histidine--tRNA ligase [Jatrophihabitans telluris]|uniref:Histidine--tRNA ligase n=1 Tax=Jatrophihabitans telluris TaxID=2038343 RepID=A0ABY4QUQ6_9ACTN|nr:histidine--tRNA ligase [Jatrophihabitans telluris]UQX86796.1 histidine--tRNA ligase [Jatrophihabitans telluris]
MSVTKPTPLSGFPELLPAERAVEQQVLDQLRATFELHGFANVETRAAEPLSQLLRKGEIDKEVYILRRLQAGEDGEDSGGDAGDPNTLGLHFDLTVPFARYVLENAGKLDFPFRRYQIQKVWRGERPQEGRYREFTQADIDVVAAGELPFHHDVEVARVMAEALSRLPLPPLRLQINNRKLIEGFYRGLGAPDVASVMRVVDKIDKVPADIVATMLVNEAGLSDDQAKQCLALAEIRSSDSSFVERVRALGVEDELLETGLQELATVISGCAGVATERFVVEADLRIARGLDYYTGTVFETRMAGFESLGSICSGGRYDSLANDGRTSYPGVGISLGVTRLLTPLFTRKKLTASRSVPSAVLVALPDEGSREQCIVIAAQLRARGIPTEVAVSAQKYGKQIRYAERRGIPYVWFPADSDSAAESGAPIGHQVKDIRSGDQLDADPQTWTPPAEDLRPQVVRSEP